MASLAASEPVIDANWLKGKIGRHAFHPMIDPKQTVATPPPVMLRTIVNKFIISPPLIFTKANADEVVDVLDQALAKTPR